MRVSATCSVRSLGLVLILLATVSQAEVLELEGTVKSIDPDTRAISIVRKTPKGEKILDLEVAKNAGDISGLRVGDRVSFTYNSDVEVISRIEMGLDGDGAADKKSIEGVWKVIVEQEFGNELSKEEMRRRNRHITFKGNTLSCDRVSDGALGTYAGTFNLDPKTKAFTFTGKGPQGKPLEWIGIYQLDGDTLTLCYRIKRGDTSVTRPKEFKSEAGNPGTILFKCRREE